MTAYPWLDPTAFPERIAYWRAKEQAATTDEARDWAARIAAQYERLAEEDRRRKEGH